MKIFYWQGLKPHSYFPFYHKEFTEKVIADTNGALCEKVEDADVIFLFTPESIAKRIPNPNDDNKIDEETLERIHNKPILLINSTDGKPIHMNNPAFARLIDALQKQIFLCFDKDAYAGNIYYTYTGIQTYDYIFPILPYEYIVHENIVGETQDFSSFSSREYDISMICSCFSLSRKRFIKALETFDVPKFTYDSYGINRIHFDEVYRKSKIAVSLEGVSYKGARCHEVSSRSILLKEDYDHLYSYPWIDMENCIVLPYDRVLGDKNSWSVCLGKDELPDWVQYWYYHNGAPNIDLAFRKIKSILADKHNLYKIYVNCLDNARNYDYNNYYRNYIIPKILEFVG